VISTDAKPQPTGALASPGGLLPFAAVTPTLPSTLATMGEAKADEAQNAVMGNDPKGCVDDSEIASALY